MLAEIDILNRQEFIDKIISTVEYHSKNNLKASFSIQGEWGCGKSWILDRVFESLYDIQDENIAGGRYCVFRYNAWKYDYYEEPLVSLLISLKEQLDSENSILFKTPKAQENYQAVKKMIKEKLLDTLDVIQKNPLFSIIDSQTFHIPKLICLGVTVKKEFEEYKDKVKEEIRQYDPHYDLNQLMNSMIKGLNKISSEKTVVVIVDELDRCLPEHAIKVLERMHHISQNVNNIQFIYGIDKEQIENNVAQIFDANNSDEKQKRVRIKKYLSKFISFGLQVPKAEYNEEIQKKYSELFESFAQVNTCSFDVFSNFKLIVNILSPRDLEIVIKKIILSNGILKQNKEKLDNSILIFELYSAVLYETGHGFAGCFLKNDYHFQTLELRNPNSQSFADIFNKMISSNPIIYSHSQRAKDDYPLWTDNDNGMKAIFESAIVFYCDKIMKFDNYYFDDKTIQKEMENNSEYLKQFISYYVSLDM